MCSSRWLGLLFFLLLFSVRLSAQDSLLILDENANPLYYAYVELRTDDGVTTAVSGGSGQVALPADFHSVRITFTGYMTEEISAQELEALAFSVKMKLEETFLTGAIVVGRRDENYREVNQQVGVISAEEIARAQSLTTADALADLGGVYVQKSQFGGGSPVIRGFEANRVLLVVDGVRMNNAIYRNGHLQNAITVDPLALDRMELLFGAGALAYGSDALGGVVHFRTQQPTFRVRQASSDGARTQGAVDGKIAMSFGSAAEALVVGAKLNYGAENWAGLTLLSLSSTSHLRAGAQRPDRFPDFGRRDEYLELQNGVDVVVQNENPNVQVGTAYSQINLLQKFRFRLRDKLELSANFQFSTTSDVPRYDALTERRVGAIRWARWDYGPQTRVLGALRLNDRRPTVLYDVAAYLISYQFVAEDRIMRLANEEFETNNLEEVNAINFQTDFSKRLTPLLILRYGADLRYDAVQSEAFLQSVFSGETLTGVPSRYPSQGSSLAAAGVYAEARYELSPAWALRGGFRISRQRLTATFGTNDGITWPQAYLDGIENTESAATATLGIRQSSGWRILYAQGFRAPNIDDFAKFRERNGFIQVPNLDLQPERSHTLEAGYRWDDARLFGRPFTAELTGYHTWLRNAIVRGPGSTPGGIPITIFGGDTLRPQTNLNAQSARIYGADLVLSYEISPVFNIRTDAHYLRGRRFEAILGEEGGWLPQDHIPPPYGSTSLTYAKGPWTLGLRFRYQLAKRLEDYAVGEILPGGDSLIFDRTGTSDNLELTPVDANGNFTGSYGWWTANLSAQYCPSDRWTFRLKADNLLDKHYRTFASGVSAPGTDVGLGLEWSF